MVAFVVAGCARAGELVMERRSVETEGAESVSTEFSMNTGNLVVGGGAENLMDATFTYDVPELKPEVDYGGLGDEKELSVEQPDVMGPTFGDVRNDWEILLNDDLPIDLSAENSSGDGRFDLGSEAPAKESESSRYPLPRPSAHMRHPAPDQGSPPQDRPGDARTLVHHHHA